jgi:D-arabinose 1-dehydrogenase-like Zn-dependent alcohol dehydrogenase
MDHSTMRAIVMRSTGGPEVLKVEELPVPAAGTGEVLVRTEASGIRESIHGCWERGFWSRTATAPMRSTSPLLPTRSRKCQMG